MRVTHVITDLGVGGAQIMLQQLVSRLQVSGVSNTVIALGGVSPRFEVIRQLGIPLHALGMTPPVPGPQGWMRLRRTIAASRPDVVQTWMYHADLMAGLVTRLSGLAPVVWGLHHTPDRAEGLKPLTRCILRVNGWLSTLVPVRIVCCAHASKKAHAALGYDESRMVVINNGFDIDLFRPDPDARRSVRRELLVDDTTPLIGLMARFHPQKDHRNFVKAAARLAAQRPDAQFVLAGRGVNGENAELAAWLAESGIASRVHLLGTRQDMPRLLAACDILTSAASVGEAFPLVLGEAMSCGVPCVTTDVGDSATLVGPTGRVVAPRDSDGLAAAWSAVLSMPADERRRLGELARRRIALHFPLAACAAAYQAVYEAAQPQARMGRAS